jgi:hypothetical protein
MAGGASLFLSFEEDNLLGKGLSLVVNGLAY